MDIDFGIGNIHKYRIMKHSPGEYEGDEVGETVGLDVGDLLGLDVGESLGCS